jgi:hypothetical protein
VANLRGQGSGWRDNGNTFLQAGTTVITDGSIDRLKGGAGRDWFFSSLEDEMLDKKASDFLN